MTSFVTPAEGRQDGEAPAQRARPAAALPCLNSHNSNEPLSGSHRRTAYALTENVKFMAHDFGLERLGFLTLTFRDHVTEIKEAQRRFNSLRTGVIAKRYPAGITVLERMQSGRIHFHILIACAEDIRTGFNFEALKGKVYQSANAYLRAEWAFWRKTGPAYGFGRHELLPVKSNAEGIAKYLGKYIAKHIGNRRPEDKGARLVRYTGSACHVGTNFAWVSPRATLNRLKLAQFAAGLGIKSMDGMKHTYDRHWAYRLRGPILDEVLTVYPSKEHALIDGMDDVLKLPDSAISISGLTERHIRIEPWERVPLWPARGNPAGRIEMDAPRVLKADLLPTKAA